MPYFECCKPIVFRFAGEILEAKGRARGGQPTRAAEARRPKRSADQIEIPAQRYGVRI